MENNNCCNKYNTFDNCKFEYYEPISFRKANFDYLESNNQPYASWRYGDNIDLEIDLNQFEEFRAPYKGYTRLLKFEFLNFRYETIYTDEAEFTINNCPWEDDDEYKPFNITISISNSDSSKYFKRGIYFLRIIMTEYPDSENTYVQTLFEPIECTLLVK